MKCDPQSPPPSEVRSYRAILSDQLEISRLPDIEQQDSAGKRIS
ncbi:hypothetical protein N8553_00150 [bacterium]|nr:hypothetical protein [Planctomicrobium sp.]MDA7503374.1 hypothetical protein [bacterium]